MSFQRLSFNVDILITAKGSVYDFRNGMILGNWRVVEAPFSKVYIEPSTTATRHVITQHYFFLSHILESRKEIWHFIKSLIFSINILYLLFIFQLQNTNNLSENQFIQNKITFDLYTKPWQINAIISMYLIRIIPLQQLDTINKSQRHSHVSRGHLKEEAKILGSFHLFHQY